MKNSTHKNLLDSLPMYIAIFENENSILFGNKLWDKINYKDGNFNFTEEKIFSENGLTVFIKKVFKGEMNYKSKPLYCEPGFLSFTDYFNNNYLKFIIFLKKNSENQIEVFVLIDIFDQNDFEKLPLQEISNTDSIINVLQILETERKRISGDLHDEVIQNLLVAKLELDLYAKSVSDDKVKLDQISEIINDSLNDLRLLIQTMHPGIVEKNGIIKATEILLARLKTGNIIDIEFNIFGEYFFSSKIIEMNIYRVFQEALSNIKKHSMATKVEIQLHFTAKMIIGSIIDNGIGFDIKEVTDGNRSFGLLSMQERLKSVNGELFLESDKKGSKIIFHIPV